MTDGAYGKGEDGEELVESTFHAEGWLTTPARTHRVEQDQAPLFLGSQEKVIMPDLYAMHAGGSVWAEVKQFEEPVHTRKRDQDEHGIRSRKWEAYKRVADECGQPVWLFVFEEASGDLLAIEVHNAPTEPPVSRDACRHHYGESMTFIPRQAFEQIRLTPRHTPDDFGFEPVCGVGVALSSLLEPEREQAKFISEMPDAPEASE